MPVHAPVDVADVANLQPAPPVRTPVASRVGRSGEILALVRSGRAQTTSDLAKALGVVRSTVSDRVELLVEHGFLISDGERQVGRGRPSTHFSFNPRAGLVLAAQLGLSGVRVAVTDLDCNVLAGRTVDVDAHLGPEEVLGVVDSTFDDVLQDAGAGRSEVLGVGVGVPGAVELSMTPAATGASHRPWGRFDVAAHLASVTRLPVYVDQDLNLMALGEQQSSWPQARLLLCVKVGTTIGCGVVVDGAVLAGGSGLAGEIGHCLVPGSTALCACGNTGCLNAVASGSALAVQLRAAGIEARSARDIARRAQTGDLAVTQALRQAGRDIGVVLSSAINLLNPDVVTVWGYLADARDHLLAGIREAVYAHVVPAAQQGLRIERAGLGDDAGIHGAAMLAVGELLRPEAVDALVWRRVGPTAG